MTKIAKIIIGVIIIILLIGAVWFFLNQKPTQGKIKIGIMTMTTGSLAFLGDNVVKSAELAVKELGYEGKVDLIIEDVGQLGAGKDTIAAYRKLVDADKVQVIIDGMTSDGTLAVAPLLENDKVVMITPLTGGENIDNASEYLFRNGPSDAVAGTKPAQELINKFNYQTIALLTDNAQYTIDISKHFRTAYKGTIASDQIITSDKTDYRTEIEKMQTKNYDAIVINTATGTSAQYIIKELYEAGNTKPIFANFIAFGPNLITTAGAGAEGVYIYDPEFDENSQATKSFFTEYKQVYKIDPVIPFHSTGTYDAVKMIVEAVMKSKYNGNAIHDYLLSDIKNWQGLNGVVSFDAKGNTQTGFILKQVKSGKLVPIN